MAETTFVVDAAGKPTINKDPDAILDYTFDWTTWLDTDTIVSAAAIVTGSDTANVVATYYTTTKVTIWVSGGVVPDKIALRCRIQTAAGRVDDRTVYLKVKER